MNVTIDATINDEIPRENKIFFLFNLIPPSRLSVHRNPAVNVFEVCILNFFRTNNPIPIVGFTCPIPIIKTVEIICFRCLFCFFLPKFFKQIKPFLRITEIKISLIFFSLFSNSKRIIKVLLFQRMSVGLMC